MFDDEVFNDAPTATTGGVELDAFMGNRITRSSDGRRAGGGACHIQFSFYVQSDIVIEINRCTSIDDERVTRSHCVVAGQSHGS